MKQEIPRNPTFLCITQLDASCPKSSTVVVGIIPNFGACNWYIFASFASIVSESCHSQLVESTSEVNPPINFLPNDCFITLSFHLLPTLLSQNTDGQGPEDSINRSDRKVRVRTCAKGHKTSLRHFNSLLYHSTPPHSTPLHPKRLFTSEVYFLCMTSTNTCMSTRHLELDSRRSIPAFCQIESPLCGDFDSSLAGVLATLPFLIGREKGIDIGSLRLLLMA
ncbi:unnamed protein product [Protopolystoma xenopodis]|uniref:Uncharacterized protein n=1 Tax=Protopolystoma xenopodis TaxID=117903 RepID=A0A3S5AJG7_9PLAT|nr:unnamed protein product [Protopolystoma xenopodis]